MPPVKLTRAVFEAPPVALVGVTVGLRRQGGDSLTDCLGVVRLRLGLGSRDSGLLQLVFPSLAAAFPWSVKRDIVPDAVQP